MYMYISWTCYPDTGPIDIILTLTHSSFAFFALDLAIFKTNQNNLKPIKTVLNYIKLTIEGIAFSNNSECTPLCKWLMFVTLVNFIY